MNTNSKLLSAALALGLTAWVCPAQDSEAPPRRGERPPREGSPGGPGGPGFGGQRPMVSPLIAALDANRDGVIDEKEIENAAAALRTLDKNKDGKLTMDELRPPRPEGAGRPGFDRGPGEPREPRGPLPNERPRRPLPPNED